MIIEFEPYYDLDLPIPRPWQVDKKGYISTPAFKEFEARLLHVDGNYATISLHGNTYTFEQKISSIKEMA